ncbi:hypothetical protein L5515_009911 [Caenorhabditis briggsae]|uniref:Protein CBR-DPY-21 n=1 Tax=Caenorhabditis briggsae TaxID=6238 RepID=A0AAE9F5B1_CAEBR|nr:hypothetical protein L5515_009911 [Caenorhabditis briggsae]
MSESDQEKAARERAMREMRIAEQQQPTRPRRGPRTPEGDPDDERPSSSTSTISSDSSIAAAQHRPARRGPGTPPLPPPSDTAFYEQHFMHHYAAYGYPYPPGTPGAHVLASYPYYQQQYYQYGLPPPPAPPTQPFAHQVPVAIPPPPQPPRLDTNVPPPPPKPADSQRTMVWGPAVQPASSSPLPPVSVLSHGVTPILKLSPNSITGSSGFIENASFAFEAAEPALATPKPPKKHVTVEAPSDILSGAHRTTVSSSKKTERSQLRNVPTSLPSDVPTSSHHQSTPPARYRDVSPPMIQDASFSEMLNPKPQYIRPQRTFTPTHSPEEEERRRRQMEEERMEEELLRMREAEEEEERARKRELREREEEYRRMEMERKAEEEKETMKDEDEEKVLETPALEIRELPCEFFITSHLPMNAQQTGTSAEKSTEALEDVKSEEKAPEETISKPSVASKSTETSQETTISPAPILKVPPKPKPIYTAQRSLSIPSKKAAPTPTTPISTLRARMEAVRNKKVEMLRNPDKATPKPIMSLESVKKEEKHPETSNGYHKNGTVEMNGFSSKPETSNGYNKEYHKRRDESNGHQERKKDHYEASERKHREERRREEERQREEERRREKDRKKKYDEDRKHRERSEKHRDTEKSRKHRSPSPKCEEKPPVQQPVNADEPHVSLDDSADRLVVESLVALSSHRDTNTPDNMDSSFYSEEPTPVKNQEPFMVFDKLKAKIRDDAVNMEQDKSFGLLPPAEPCLVYSLHTHPEPIQIPAPVMEEELKPAPFEEEPVQEEVVEQEELIVEQQPEPTEMAPQERVQEGADDEQRGVREDSVEIDVCADYVNPALTLDDWQPNYDGFQPICQWDTDGQRRGTPDYDDEESVVEHQAQPVMQPVLEENVEAVEPVVQEVVTFAPEHNYEPVAPKPIVPVAESDPPVVLEPVAPAETEPQLESQSTAIDETIAAVAAAAAIISARTAQARSHRSPSVASGGAPENNRDHRSPSIPYQNGTRQNGHTRSPSIAPTSVQDKPMRRPLPGDQSDHDDDKPGPSQPPKKDVPRVITKAALKQGVLQTPPPQRRMRQLDSTPDPEEDEIVAKPPPRPPPKLGPVARVIAHARAGSLQPDASDDRRDARRGLPYRPPSPVRGSGRGRGRGRPPGTATSSRGSAVVSTRGRGRGRGAAAAAAIQPPRPLQEINLNQDEEIRNRRSVSVAREVAPASDHGLSAIMRRLIGLEQQASDSNRKRVIATENGGTFVAPVPPKRIKTEDSRNNPVMQELHRIRDSIVGEIDVGDQLNEEGETTLEGICYPKKEKKEPSSSSDDRSGNSAADDIIHVDSRSAVLAKMACRAKEEDPSSISMTTLSAMKLVEKEMAEREAHKGMRVIKPEFLWSKMAAKGVTWSSPATERNLNLIAQNCDVPKISEKFRPHIRITKHPNGGGFMLFADYHLFKKDFPDYDDRVAFCRQFQRLSMVESEQGTAQFCIANMENGAEDLRNMMEFLYEVAPELNIKCGNFNAGILNTQTKKFSEYYEKVLENYDSGTFKWSPLEAVQLVGKKAEESGGYFPDLIYEMEKHAFLNSILPWGNFTTRANTAHRDSNDGPILWVRPGEQTVPTSNSGTTSLRAAGNREIEFLDRTPAHADQADDPEATRITTGAIGILQGIPGKQADYPEERRVMKEVVSFFAGDIEEVVKTLKIDLFEPPATQTTMWVDDAKLNTMRRSGIRYAKFELRENDLYFIPRKVVHQFRTVSACVSLAWHVRLQHYYNNDQNYEATVHETIKRYDAEFDSEGPSPEGHHSHLSINSAASMGRTHGTVAH